tara:strand:+ start:2581 stop:2730 length:150 start_codon:yes stop_codon:yes gene_type:complete
MVSPHVLRRAEALTKELKKEDPTISRSEVMDAAMEVGLTEKGVRKTLGL